VPAYPAGPYLQNGANISTPGQAKNFLYLINPEHYAAKADFIRAVASTSYDLLIIDFFHNDLALTSADIDQLRNKASGGQRLVICYLSIGEAEDYRFYWQSSWKKNRPEWLEPENPDWPGNYKVKYWHPDWQQIIFGHPEAYLDRIISAGFDGVYLDIIDGFEYFEEK
jgi:cysteinyl-tRNA synthetase